MKLNSQIKILMSVLLFFTVIICATVFLQTQFRDKQGMISDVMIQKNRFLERVVSHESKEKVAAAFATELRIPEWSRSLLVDKSGNVIYQDPFAAKFKDASLIKSEKLTAALNNSGGEGLIRDQSGKESVFMAFKVVPGIGFILSVAPASLVYSSMLFQVLQVLATSIFVLGLGLIIFSLVLNKMTWGLEELSVQTKSFGEGNLKSRMMEALGSQEINSLAKSFNSMAKNIEDLILVKEKKSSIDAEIHMAERVQMSFFPEMNVTSREYSLAAFTQQMSGCGGDWIYHFRTGSSLFVAVGDVTGHGLSSALLTGVSRTFFSVLEDNENNDPAELLEKLNKVLYKVAKGTLTMTFFLARIDLKNGDVEFANASHCTPFVCGPSGENVLLSEPGPILGRQLISKYRNEKTKLRPGDILFLYTDGLVELKTAQGRHLGERRLLKAMTELFANQSFETLSPKLSSYVRQTKGTQELEDDLSWLILRFNEPS